MRCEAKYSTVTPTFGGAGARFNPNLKHIGIWGIIPRKLSRNPSFGFHRNSKSCFLYS